MRILSILSLIEYQFYILLLSFYCNKNYNIVETILPIKTIKDTENPKFLIGSLFYKSQFYSRIMG